MKNAPKLLALLFFAALFFSCTPQSISDSDRDDTLNISATGGDTSAELDNDKDGE